MIIDPSGMTRGDIYRFMTRAVVPRPIALVSTVNEEGLSNVAPFSYFNALTAEPPLFGISVANRASRQKDTLRNIRNTEEFVINVVSEVMAERMVQSSGDWPDDVSEFAVTGLTEIPCNIVDAPRVGESLVSMECRLHRIVDLRSTHFIIGEMILAHVDENVLTDGQIDIEKLKPVARLGGDEYAIVRNVMHMARPAVSPQGDR